MPQRFLKSSSGGCYRGRPMRPEIPEPEKLIHDLTTLAHQLRAMRRSLDRLTPPPRLQREGTLSPSAILGANAAQDSRRHMSTGVPE
jgi:hypothetical protein